MGGFAVRMFMLLLARIKVMGFLEWAGVASLVDTILTYDVKQQMFQLVCEYAAVGAGLQLDPTDPFSDASLSGAVSERIGVPIRSLKNKEMIKEDMGNAAAAMASEKSGYKIRSLTDVAVMRQDLERIGCALLTAKLGLPAGVLPGEGEDINPAAVRERLLLWAKAELAVELNDQVAFGAKEIEEGVYRYELSQLADMINSRLAVGSGGGGFDPVTARQIAVKLATDISVDAVANFQRSAMSARKRTRRQEQLRAAQERFRRSHGNRQQYIPLGMVGSVGDMAFD